MSTSQVIAIDGPAASGKSSVARRVAAALGRLHVNTGNHYRAITRAVLESGFDVKETHAIAAYVEAMPISFTVDEQNVVHIQVNGRGYTDAELNTEDVNASVSHVAAIPEVRSRLVAAQRSLVEKGALVMEGRDIGSVVFPDSPHKFYIDASEEVRLQRVRLQGRADSVAMRDKLDKSRKTAPLVIPEGALRIDSSDLTLEEVVQQVLDSL